MVQLALFIIRTWQNWQRLVLRGRNSPSVFASPIRGLPTIALALCLHACTSDPPPVSAPIHYTEVSDAAGLDFVHYNGARGDYFYPETMGSGAAFLDYDNDGWQDIYLVNGTYLTGLPPDPLPSNRLYRNTGDGKFADVTAASGSGDTGYGMGCAVADYDNDGDQDLYITNVGSNVLYRNEGRGRFVDIARQAGVGDERWGTSSGFLDFDLDGDLDLFVVNYVEYALDQDHVCRRGRLRSYCAPIYYQPIGDILYRNDGGQFTDVTQEAGITQVGWGLGVAFSDFDLDGDTDVYVANDGSMNSLYENRRGHFVDTGLQAGARYNENGRSEAGMGVDFGDFDNDGHQDIFVTNFALETNTLYRNTGQGRFHDVTTPLGLAEPSFVPLGFGTRFLDFDNDAYLDLFVANGHVVDVITQTDSSQSYPQRNQLFHNEAGTRFVDVSAFSGPSFAVENVARGLAMADYDNDGDQDLLVTTEAGRPRLLRNDGGNHNHWLLIHLEGTHQRDALGARVTVTAGGTRQIKERQSGSSYLSSHDPRLHFGLGRATHADVEIRWPDGQIQTLSGVEADQILHIVQPTH